MNTSAIQGGSGRLAAAESGAPKRSPAPEGTAEIRAGTEPKIDPTPDQVQAAVESLQQMAASMDIKLNFKLSQTDNEVVVKVLNRETNEVIREIPPKSIRRLADRMAELNGLLFDSRA
jgi:flagellar protein FlaG